MNSVYRTSRFHPELIWSVVDSLYLLGHIPTRMGNSFRFSSLNRSELSDDVWFIGQAPGGQQTTVTDSDTACRTRDGQHKLWTQVAHSHSQRMQRHTSQDCPV